VKIETFCLVNCGPPKSTFVIASLTIIGVKQDSLGEAFGMMAQETMSERGMEMCC